MTKVTQYVAPEARAKRCASSMPGNIAMHIMMNWHHYRHLGMTAETRDRIIAGLREDLVDVDGLCEALGIPTEAIDRDLELLESARAEVERAAAHGIRVLGSA